MTSLSSFDSVNKRHFSNFLQQARGINTNDKSWSLDVSGFQTNVPGLGTTKEYHDPLLHEALLLGIRENFPTIVNEFEDHEILILDCRNINDGADNINLRPHCGTL